MDGLKGVKRGFKARAEREGKYLLTWEGRGLGLCSNGSDNIEVCADHVSSVELAFRPCWRDDVTSPFKTVKNLEGLILGNAFARHSLFLLEFFHLLARQCLLFILLTSFKTYGHRVILQFSRLVALQRHGRKFMRGRKLCRCRYMIHVFSVTWCHVQPCHVLLHVASPLKPQWAVGKRLYFQAFHPQPLARATRSNNC